MHSLNIQMYKLLYFEPINNKLCYLCRLATARLTCDNAKQIFSHSLNDLVLEFIDRELLPFFLYGCLQHIMIDFEVGEIFQLIIRLRTLHFH